jgi:hypothetical protein
MLGGGENFSIIYKYVPRAFYQIGRCEDVQLFSNHILMYGRFSIETAEDWYASGANCV